MNSVNIIGNMTRNIEIKQVSENFSVGTFGIAVNKKVKKNGEYVDKAMFFDITAYNKTAENIGRFFDRGSKIGISGELDFDSWENDKGKHSKVSIICREFSFIDKKADSKAPSNYNYSQPAPSAPKAAPQPTSNIPEIDINEELPF